MEEDNDLDVMNINQEIKNKKKEDDIINAHITKEIISNFNSSIKALFSGVNDSKISIITNRKIYIYFLHKYLYSRNIVYLLNNKNKSISIKNTKKIINYLYSFILFYIFIEHKPIKQQLIELKLLSLDEFFRIIIILYKSKLLSFQNVINFFKFNLILLKKNNFLTIPQKSNIISRFIKYLWKFSKEIIIKNNEKEIDKLIKKEILTLFFDIINDADNEYNYFYLLNNFKKEENIFLFIKMIINNKYLSDETISLIESNIIKFLKNNFRKEHFNYFYKICSKILIKFNNLNPKQFRKTLPEPKKDYLSLNQDFTFLAQIFKILTKIITEEKKNMDNSCYYCEKGFVFNIEGKNKVGFKVKDIVYNPSKKGSTFCVLFSFLLRENKITNENKIIFSINDSNNKEYLCLYEKGQKLYLRYITKKINEKEIIKKIKYNNYYSFFFYNDKNKNIIKICINYEDIFSEKDQSFNIPNKFQIFVGAPDSNENLKECEYSFNGIIFPILLFELNNKDDIYSEIKNNLFKVKNYYYLIAENYYESNMNENIYDNNYEKYYGLYDVLESKENAKIIINNIKNIILYINPYIVLSSFNKKIKIYKDYNYYENNDDKKNKKIQYFYEFNVIPSSDIGIIYPFKNNSIISFFKNNSGLNLIILEFELMYNYIFLINNNNNFSKILSENKKEMFSLM